MILKMMQWMWLIIVCIAHLQDASTDNDTTTEVVPASEYYVELQTDVVGNDTEAVYVTAESDDVDTSVHDVTTSGAPSLSTLVHVEHTLINDTQSGNKTLVLVKDNDSKSQEKSTGLESSKNESTDLSGYTLTIEPLTTLQTEIVTSYATETELQTVNTHQEELISTLESVTTTLHPSSSVTPISKTLDSSVVTSPSTNSSTAGANGRGDVTEDLVASLVSNTNSSSYRAATITSTSSVPKDSLLTTPSTSTITYPTSTQTPPTTERLTWTEKTSPTEVKTVKTYETVSKEYEIRTTADLPVKHATPELFEESPPGASTLQVTEEVTDEDGYDEEYSDSVETEYERSLRTRRVINHAALWITIGFVVVLVSYITALVIYNRTRPDWQDSLRPYSRFENEPENLPEYDDNNMEYDNYGVTDDFPQHENRRDFSQSVDPRDFPPCDGGEQEYLLYEDPTYIDQATCTDFSYHDEC
ncbi:cell wall integrity and stress response component 4-like [Asterias rubens]|uniref:cell wall integrity and stress response component 4-like n=1 Tax=Asterias rubens TaxID=7604 RepID=UPI00145509D8|nr:cell wall integrity and stress response component 4-like [Asterias rubens]